MKKLLAILMIAVMAFSIVACSAPATESSESSASEESASEESTSEESTSEEESAAEEVATGPVTITVTDEAGEPIDVEFPDPSTVEKVVVLNWQTVDFLDSVGMGDKIVGIIKGGSVPEHLAKYAEDESIASVGGMKEPDFEAIMELEPDIIFSSDRTESMYQEFSAIAPTFAAFVDYGDSFMEGYKALAEKHGQIFGIEGEVAEIIAGYETRIAAIADFAEGKTALLGIFAGGLNTLGDTGRCNIITTDMGFTNLAAGEDVNHGNVSSYELFLELNPDYMFILDKDTAVGTEAVAAKEQMETDNPVIAETDAYKNGNIFYLEPDTAWYVADGGITSLDLMIANIEEALGLA